jgi:hypothetical protein
MKNLKHILFLMMLFCAFKSTAQMNVPAQTSGTGPLGPTNSLLTFISGGPPNYPTAIQEVWGLNLCGTNVQPVKVYNASLLVGYQSNNQDYGTGNIFATGYVGIGTTDTKGYKLGVNGSVIATSVTVKAYGTWADYVFKSTYKLPSLLDVKAFIDQHQHLPEIPSADEVEKNGQNLGEMNRLLLKKVEELTLYAIENERKDKEREEAKDKLLTSLQEQINALKQQLTIVQKGVKQ